MTLLTLVENAVRHGIDPSEEGGRIDIHVQRRGDRCVVRVSDTGAGLRQTGNGLGTGLSTLRERLQLTFGGDAQLRVTRTAAAWRLCRAGFPGTRSDDMMSPRPTALIADDEPLLREALARQLAQAWPELEVVAQARNGREAIEQFEALRPDVCFLDVHMPGLSGVEAAHHIGRRAHLVFVTAYDQYAVQAFAQGALDYLVKPVEPARLAETVARLKERLQAAQPALNTEALLQQLAAQLAQLHERRGAGAAALDSRAGRTDPAADPGRRDRLPALRHEVHARRLARRCRPARRGAGPHRR